MRLTDNQLLQVIDATPLVSIDLIIKNNNSEVLLGKRVNRPAQNFWFVPGGRITKNEKITDALKRISSNEINLDLSAYQPKLFGAYDHIYDDNFLHQAGINTHYVVLAYMVDLDENIELAPDNQHSEIRWWSVNNLLDSPDVHQNTKAYFLAQE
jgi:colanic acid biosynthesis protein WcaH